MTDGKGGKGGSFSYPKEAFDGKKPAPETMMAKTKVEMKGAAGSGFVLPEYCSTLLSKHGLQVCLKYLESCELYQKNDLFRIVQSLNFHVEESRAADKEKAEKEAAAKKAAQTEKAGRTAVKIKPTVAAGTMPAAVKSVAPSSQGKATQDTTDSRAYAKEYLSDDANALLTSWFAAQASSETKRIFRHVFRRLYFADHPTDTTKERPTTPPQDKPRFLS